MILFKRISILLAGFLHSYVVNYVQEGSGSLSVSLGIAAATGLGLLAFTEVGLISLLHTVFIF